MDGPSWRRFLRGVFSYKRRARQICPSCRITVPAASGQGVVIVLVHDVLKRKEEVTAVRCVQKGGGNRGTRSITCRSVQESWREALDLAPLPVLAANWALLRMRFPNQLQSTRTKSANDSFPGGLHCSKSMTSTRISGAYGSKSVAYGS